MRVVLSFLATGLIVISSVSALAGQPAQPAEPKATVTYGSYLEYSDGRLLDHADEGNRIDTNGGTGAFDFGTDEGLKFCPTKSQMICIQTGYGQDFAIPRKALSVGDTWVFNGTAFMLVPSAIIRSLMPPPLHEKAITELHFLGQTISFYVVARMGDDGKYPVHLYLFSPERGLIGEAVPQEGASLRVIWLQEAYGPGSKEFDSQISPKALLSEADVEKLLNMPLTKLTPVPASATAD